MKKILAFVMLVSFISGAGLMFSGCSSDSKKKIINPETTPFEGTWHCAAALETCNFSGSNYIHVEGGGSPSYKGTFEYDETIVFFYSTHRASGNALMGDVVWENYIETRFWPLYSFIDENTFNIIGDYDTYTFVKIP